MSDLSSLIARLEKAEGSDGQLDADVAEASRIVPAGYERAIVHGKAQPYFWHREDRKAAYWSMPVTSSIDAAVSLAERVLPRWRYAIERRAGGMCLAWVTEEDDAPCIPAMHPHSALALVLATLRALQQKGSSNE